MIKIWQTMLDVINGYKNNLKYTNKEEMKTELDTSYRQRMLTYKYGMLTSKSAIYSNPKF